MDQQELKVEELLTKTHLNKECYPCATIGNTNEASWLFYDWVLDSTVLACDSCLSDIRDMLGDDEHELLDDLEELK